MCFSLPISLSLGILGLFLAKYSSLHQRYAYRDVILFYSLMEFLQALQYSLVGEKELVPDKGYDFCTQINTFFTFVAHVLIIVQPAMWNLFRYKTQKKNRDIFYFAFVLSIIWAVFFTTRLFYLPFGVIEPRLDYSNILVGKNVCTFSGLTHIYWTLPYYSYAGLEPNLFTYLLLWFVPTIYENKGFLKLFLWIFQITLIQYLVSSFQELPSYWCALSIPFLFLSVFQKKPSPGLLSGFF